MARLVVVSCKVQVKGLVAVVVFVANTAYVSVIIPVEFFLNGNCAYKHTWFLLLFVFNNIQFMIHINKLICFVSHYLLLVWWVNLALL